MAISPQQLTIYLYSAHRAVIFAIAQLFCSDFCFSLYEMITASLTGLINCISYIYAYDWFHSF